MDAEKIRQTAGDVVEGVRDFGRRTCGSPLGSLLIALGAGFLIGLLLRFFDRPEAERYRSE